VVSFIPTTPDDYVEAVKRKDRLIDSLNIDVVAQMHRVTVTVFEYTGSQWKSRIAFNPGEKHVIPLLLHEEHYMTLEADAKRPFPDEWRVERPNPRWRRLGAGVRSEEDSEECSWMDAFSTWEQKAAAQEDARRLKRALDNKMVKGGRGELRKARLQFRGVQTFLGHKGRKLRRRWGRLLAHKEEVQKRGATASLSEITTGRWKRLWSKREKAAVETRKYGEEVEEEIKRVEEQLHQMQKQKQQRALSHWNTRMRSGIKEVSKWLKTKLSGAPTITHKGKQAANPKVATDLIKEYWEET